jgi:predicted peptidase
MAPQTWNSWKIQARYDAIVSEIDELNAQSSIREWTSDGTKWDAIVTRVPNPWKGTIDNERLYVTGFSLGGDGAFFFLSQPSARFAAGIPVAATIGPESV